MEVSFQDIFYQSIAPPEPLEFGDLFEPYEPLFLEPFDFDFEP